MSGEQLPHLRSSTLGAEGFASPKPSRLRQLNRNPESSPATPHSKTQARKRVYAEGDAGPCSNSRGKALRTLRDSISTAAEPNSKPRSKALRTMGASPRRLGATAYR
ncbi:hypothetical protein PHYPSEUDO_011393 [Phytophthora pseudosyringae]|uniref:Uncharacterized protein n=1 Tax=Phytophthora pseudosyringae TaxID=221518 RepID=A0A8T1V8I8_9STRA|nr:hypothetical protein PHYPSEUDO_011393 [Phytophthora pseudosyringae]